MQKTNVGAMSTQSHRELTPIVDQGRTTASNEANRQEDCKSLEDASRPNPNPCASKGNGWWSSWLPGGGSGNETNSQARGKHGVLREKPSKKKVLQRPKTMNLGSTKGSVAITPYNQIEAGSRWSK